MLNRAQAEQRERAPADVVNGGVRGLVLDGDRAGGGAVGIGPVREQLAERAAFIVGSPVVPEEHPVGDLAIPPLDLVSGSTNHRGGVAVTACALVEHRAEAIGDPFDLREVVARLGERGRIGSRQRVTDRRADLLGRRGVVAGPVGRARYAPGNRRQCPESL